MSILNERMWQKPGLNYYRICIDIYATVETIYGNQQGGLESHNTKNRGKNGFRPVPCFIDQIRKCLVEKLRKGETLSGKQTAKFV